MHRSQYIRLLLATHPPDVSTALAYARAKFTPFYPQYGAEINRLMNCIIFLPISRLQASPYADLASPTLHIDLEPLFAKEYCASLGMSRQVPLRVIGDIGGGGALARIEKGRKVMRERKSEWSQSDELPVRLVLHVGVGAVCLRIVTRVSVFARLRFHCHPRIATTPFLHAPCPRSRQQSRIHP